MSNQFEKVKRELLVETLRKTQKKIVAATVLGVPYTTVYRMLQRYQIKDEEWKGVQAS